MSPCPSKSRISAATAHATAFAAWSDPAHVAPPAASSASAAPAAAAGGTSPPAAASASGTGATSMPTVRRTSPPTTTSATSPKGTFSRKYPSVIHVWWLPK